MIRPWSPPGETPLTDNFLEGENPDMMSWPEFARQLERELRQAQEDHIAVVIHAKQCEERAEQAQERIEELEVELAASDGVAFNLSEHAKCVEKDAARYRWLQDWYLREGKRSEIDEFGHIRQTTALIMDASIDAAASGPERGR